MSVLDIHQLEIYAKVAELKSFSKAAQAMYLTQPTVSQHITTLENHLGTKLFDRLGKEVVLTKAGEVLYKYAKQITGLRGEAEQALDHFLGKKSGHLTLGASTIPGEYILPPLLGKFKEQFPAIKTTLRIGDTEEIVDELLTRKIETGIIGAKISNSRLQFIPFVEDELILVVPRGHRWWNRTALGIQELTDEPFVMREAGSGTRISMEKRLSKLGIAADSLKVIAEMGSTTAVKQAIKAKLGISLVSAKAVEEEIRGKVFKKIPIKKAAFLRTFFIIRDKTQTPSPLCEALINFLSTEK
jgi:DNA-binding transcriptional LysR family regulator